MTEDRNFDSLAEKFQRKVYGGIKGAIRLAVLQRDLAEVLVDLGKKANNRPLKVLDVGAGFAQLAIWLAGRGHCVTVNDISAGMLLKARAGALDAGVSERMNWHCCPYQELVPAVGGQKYDLVLCHALMEWLAEPDRLLDSLASLLAEGAALSLAFYNRHALVYRNLLQGNFRLLDSGRLQGDAGSLTPGNPQLPETVAGLVAGAGLEVTKRSGIRVFNDYVQVLRGGNENPQAVIAMEMRYSTREPYLWLGRYIHFICRRAQVSGQSRCREAQL